MNARFAIWDSLEVKLIKSIWEFSTILSKGGTLLKYSIRTLDSCPFLILTWLLFILSFNAALMQKSIGVQCVQKVSDCVLYVVLFRYLYSTLKSPKLMNIFLVYSAASRLYIHMRTHSDQPGPTTTKLPSTESTQGPVQCDYCQKFYADKRCLSRHIRIHLQPEECAKCQLKFTDRHQYLLHMKMEHPMHKKHKCTMCLNC